MWTMFAMSLPGLVVLLFAVALLDQAAVKAGRTRWIPWRGDRRAGQVSSTGFAQLHAAFDPGKQHDLANRQTMTLLREDEADGAPPGTRIDLTAGTATLTRPDSGPAE